MKLTPWYPGTVKPVRVGVYERSFIEDCTPDYSYWNGSAWGLSSDTPTAARRHMHDTSVWQDLPWRGVKK